MRSDPKADRETKSTMRVLIADELESVSGGTTYPPGDDPPTHCPCGGGCPS